MGYIADATSRHARLTYILDPRFKPLSVRSWTSSQGVKTSSVLSSVVPGSRRGCVSSTTRTTRTMSPPRRRHQGVPHTLRAAPRVAPALYPRSGRERPSHLPTSLQVRTRRMRLMTQCSPDAPTTVVLTMTSLTSTWHCRRLRTQRRVLVSGVSALVL